MKKKHALMAAIITTLSAASMATRVAVAQGNPEIRQAFFGDLHLHTTNSFDAYVLMGTKTTPEQAYQFGRGDTIDYLGEPIRRSTPLDFMAVTDHSENLGVYNELDDPDSTLSKSSIGQRIRQGWEDGTLNISAKRNGTDAQSGGVSSASTRRLDGHRSQTRPHWSVSGISGRTRARAMSVGGT